VIIAISSKLLRTNSPILIKNHHLYPMIKLISLTFFILLSCNSFADGPISPVQDNPLENLTDAQKEARKEVMETLSQPNSDAYRYYQEKVRTDQAYRQQLGMVTGKYSSEQKTERQAFKDAYNAADQATKDQMKDQIRNDANLRARLGIVD
jgi:hypothetical protein